MWPFNGAFLLIFIGLIFMVNRRIWVSVNFVFGSKILHFFITSSYSYVDILLFPSFCAYLRRRRQQDQCALSFLYGFHFEKVLRSCKSAVGWDKDMDLDLGLYGTNFFRLNVVRLSNFDQNSIQFLNIWFYYFSPSNTTC